ncbi:MAG TPA: protein translocase subunit SecF, partial [Thermomicrobiales bacterium]|nr:protein translocase subunit SecF [Thermomicrobiales bacterium]
KRKLWFTISLLVIIPGLVSLIFSGLKLGIDFTGGTLWEVRFSQPATALEVETALREAGVETAIVQRSGPADDETFLIRMPEVTEGSARKAELEQALEASVGPFTEREYATVGGALSTQIRNRAILAVALASIGILLYMAYAFRNTQRPLLYGSSALVAMLHDVLIVLGIFSILGLLFNVQIDALFITALLTVIGFSVHDTIVVFDRIRENLAKLPDESFESIVDYSLAQTVVRSLNTSLTVIFTLLALVLFGGGSTRMFVLALLIGIISGTYSSIFNASQLLVAWENGEIQRFFRRFTGARADQALPAG